RIGVVADPRDPGPRRLSVSRRERQQRTRERNQERRNRLSHICPSHGHFGVKFMITASWVPPLVAVRDPRSKPFVMTWSVSGTRSNSHSVAARSSGTNIPLASGEGSGGRDHSLRSAYPSHGLMRFVHLDPPGLIRSREIAGKGAAAC